MSELFERFADLPAFLDYRQDQMMDVLRTVQSLDNVSSEDPDEVIRMIQELHVERVYNAYRNKHSESLRGNSNLRWRIRSASFRNFKAVLGADDYV